MTIQDIAAVAAQEKLAGIRYQKSGRAGFRDRVTVYRDGTLLFERFCYGEAAGLVFEMRGKGADADGTLLWDYDACRNSHKTEAPQRLSAGDTTTLQFDEKNVAWNCTDRLKSDPAHGYSALGGFFGRLFGR